LSLRGVKRTVSLEVGLAVTTLTGSHNKKKEGETGHQKGRLGQNAAKGKGPYGVTHKGGKNGCKKLEDEGRYKGAIVLRHWRKLSKKGTVKKTT